MYVTFKSVCSVCGEVYGVRKANILLKSPKVTKHIKEHLERDGYIKSHGYCPTCHRKVMQELHLVARKRVNLYT